jgi:hypothetical protein
MIVTEAIDPAYLKARLDQIVNNLNVSLSTTATLARFGRSITVGWVIGSETTAPAAGTALVSKSVTSGKTGYIYGVFISCGEANDFKINWTSGGAAVSLRVPFGGKGAVLATLEVPMNEGLPADGGTAITITNVNAGSSGIIYQAGILYGEV